MNERDRILAYLGARRQGGILATPVNSPQMSKHLDIKPRVLVRELGKLRNTGHVKWSTLGGWELAAEGVYTINCRAYADWVQARRRHLP